MKYERKKYLYKKKTDGMCGKCHVRKYKAHLYTHAHIHTLTYCQYGINHMREISTIIYVYRYIAKVELQFVAHLI